MLAITIKMTDRPVHKFSSLIKFCALVAMLFVGYSLTAQESADRILVVVGRNRIILKSDLDVQLLQIRQSDPNFSDTISLLQGMIIDKMLLEQAERDSVLVSDDDVEGQLDNKLRYFMQLYGSKEKMEQMAGKSVYQIKEEGREGIKEQMIVEKMRAQILENVKITPEEVKTFYRKIPKDSLPYFPSVVEVGQIVIDPPVSAVIDEYAHNKLAEIRKKIVETGASFETEASINSDDPGSRDNGGRIDGIARNGPYAPEFLAAAFKLQNNEISPIFKTKFGYHIIKMVSRKGDEADVEHILIRPEVTSGDFKIAMAKLDSIRELLVNKTMTFQEAVGKFSTDEAAKRTGGMVADPNTGNTYLDMNKLDPAMVLMLDTMQIGGFSKPHVFMNDMRQQSCRLVYLAHRTGPHKANLTDDYSKILEVALQQKKTLKLNTWLKNKLSSFYLKVDPQYLNYDGLKMFKESMNTEQ